MMKQATNGGGKLKQNERRGSSDPPPTAAGVSSTLNSRPNAAQSDVLEAFLLEKKVENCSAAPL